VLKARAAGIKHPHRLGMSTEERRRIASEAMNAS